MIFTSSRTKYQIRVACGHQHWVSRRNYVHSRKNLIWSMFFSLLFIVHTLVNGFRRE
jgi:hypothetical protein